MHWVRAWLFLCLIIFPHTEGAWAATPTQSQALFLVCASRGFDIGCKKAYGYATDLLYSKRLYETDRSKALEEAGLQPPNPLAAGMDESQFLAYRSRQIEQEIDGYSVGETTFGKGLSLLAGAAVATLTDGLGASLFVTTLSGGVGEAATGSLFNLIKKDGVELAPYSDQVYFYISDQIVDAANSDPTLGPLFEKYFNDKTQLDLSTSLLDQPAIQIGPMKEDIAELKSGLADVQDTVAKALDQMRQTSDDKTEQTIEFEVQGSAIPSQNDLKQYLDNQRSIESEQRQIKGFFDGLEAFGVIAQLSPQQMQQIQAGSDIMSGIYTLSNTSFDSEPTTYVGAMMLVMKGVVTILRQNKGQEENPFNGLFQQLLAISQQIAQLRAELNERIYYLDSNLSHQLAEIEDLQKAVLRAIAGEDEELADIGLKIDRLEQRSDAVSAALAARMQDQTWIQCTSMVAPAHPTTDERAQFIGSLRTCYQLAFTLGTAWSKDQTSVAPLAELTSIEEDTDPNGPYVALELNRWMPSLADIRGLDLSGIGDNHGCSTDVVNPVVWFLGARFYSTLAQQFYLYREAMKSDEIDCLITTGLILQRFYQTAMIRGQKFDVGFYWQLIGGYQKSATSFLNQVARETSVINAPLASPDQVAPGEVVGDEQTDAGMAESRRYYAHTFGNDQAVALGADRNPINVLAGRGRFNDGAMASYSVFKQPIGLCDGVKKDLSSPVTADARIPQITMSVPQQGLEHITDYTGLQFRASILAFIPRPALWLSLIDPSHFRIMACFSKLKDTVVAHPTPGSPSTMFFKSDIEFSIDIYLITQNIAEPVSGMLLRRLNYNGLAKSISAQLTMWPPPGEDPPNHLNLIWNGGKWHGQTFASLIADMTSGDLIGGAAHIGPVTLDERFSKPYFVIDPDAEQDVAKNVIAIRALVADQMLKQKQELEEKTGIGHIKTAFEDMKMHFWLLDIFLGMDAGAYPETWSLYERTHWPVDLLDPESIRKLILNGASNDDLEQQIGDQVAKLKGAASQLAASLKISPTAVTPVDGKIAELTLLRQTLPENRGGAAK